MDGVLCGSGCQVKSRTQGAEFETVCTCACESRLAVLHWILEVQKINLGSTLPLVWFSFFYGRSVCHLDWHFPAVDGWSYSWISVLRLTDALSLCRNYPMLRKEL